MERCSRHTNQIFETQLQIKILPYERFMKQVKSYTQNLNHHLQHAISHQNKSIKRKRLQLEKQLQHLKDKFFHEREKIREMEEYFARNCQSVIKADMDKWQNNQQFFREILEHYQYEVEIQTLINERNKQKITLLKQQVKECLQADIKAHVSERLESKQLSKTKQFRSKKSLSTKSQSKMTTIKLKTQASELTRRTQIHEQIHCLKPKKQKLRTQADQCDALPLISQNLIRLKTEMSLPTLKKSNIIDMERIQNDDFNFMKPIGTVKKHQKKESVIPQMIKLFKWYQLKIECKDAQADWFEKVVFNKRNLQKIVVHLQNLLQNNADKNKYPDHTNKFKDIVAKNLFRLKTESSTSKNPSKAGIKQRGLLYICQKKKPLSQQLIKDL